MNEIILFLLGSLGFVAIGFSIALLALGTMIDRFPAGDESKRTRGLASPVETTKLSVALFWGLFVLGGIAVLQENRFIMVAGITTLFAITLFMFTALVFSFAVLSAMRSRRKGAGMPAGMPVVQISPVAPLPVESPPPATVLRKRYNNPLTDFMLNALLKKE